MSTYNNEVDPNVTMWENENQPQSRNQTRVLSDAMIAKLIRAKNFQSGLFMLRQLEFSLFDFLLHSNLYEGEQIQALLNWLLYVL